MTDERRRHRRRHGGDVTSIAAVRVRPGYEAVAVDVSTLGVLIETPHRMLPGGSVELQVIGVERRLFVRGRVLRSAVAGLDASRVIYRAAVAFDRPQAWLFEEGTDGYAVPTPEVPSATPVRQPLPVRQRESGR